MSHPDPCYDPDNSFEDDMNYDDYNDFYDEDSASYHPDADHEIRSHVDDEEDDDSYDDSMDGDHDSAMESCGWGTDEDYGYYGDDTPMYDDYYGGCGDEY